MNEQHDRDDDLDIDPERGKASLQAAEEAAKADAELMARSTGVFAQLRGHRIENHWAEKIGRALRGAA